MNPIENRVQNAVALKIDETVKENTQEILEAVIGWDSFSDICEDISAAIVSDMENNSFMSQDLSLTEKQKELLRQNINGIVSNCEKVYKGKLETDKRTKELTELVKTRSKNSLERLLSAIGQEFNRGAIINAIAVAADTKSPDSNKIELRHSKSSGDLTIPTRGIFLSTNCVEAIKNSIDAAGEDEEEQESENDR